MTTIKESATKDNSRFETVLRIALKVQPQLNDDYYALTKKVIESLKSQPGCLSIQLLSQRCAEKNNEIVINFKNEDYAKGWLASNQGKSLLEMIRKVLEKKECLTIYRNSDCHNCTEERTLSNKPTPWKQWVITTIVIWPLTILVPFLLKPLMQEFPALNVWGIRHGVIAATIVLLMVYLVMPIMIKATYRWVYKK